MRAATSRACIGSGSAHAHLVDQAGLLREDLPGLDQHIGRAFVDLADAGVEHADHLGVDAGALAGLQRDVGADAGADLLRQPVAEDDGVGGAIERGQRALRICFASFDTFASRRGSMPVTLVATSRLA